MATATFLSGATCNITPTGGAAVDVSDQLSKCEVMLGFELLESTSLSDTGRQAVKGLQSVAVNLDLYLSYGATEVEALLTAIVAAGGCTIVVSPSGATESASNPEFTITAATLDASPVIMSSIGTLAVASISFSNGTWVRDIVSP
jgi:hypothetical protein